MSNYQRLPHSACALRAQTPRTSVLSAIILTVSLSFSATACLESRAVKSGGTGVRKLRTDATVNIVKFQSQTSDEWRVDSSENTYTRARELVIEGTCGEGVVKVVPNLNDTTLPIVSCESSGQFKWEYTAPADGDYSVKLIPKTSEGYVLHAQAAKIAIVVDTVPPPAPTLIQPQNPEITLNGTDLEVAGTFSSSQAVKMEGPSEATQSFSYDTKQYSFSYYLQFQPGWSRTLNFYAVDFAGNRSVPLTIYASYNVSHIIAANNFSGAGLSAPIPGDAATWTISQVSIAPFAQTDTPPHESTPGFWKLWSSFLDGTKIFDQL